MFAELKAALTAAGVGGVDEVERRWISEYRDRKSISQFIKDDIIGKKRLASMPDRITNTINTGDGSVVLRPTVINCFEGDIATIEIWWNLWIQFIFNTKINIKSKTGLKSVVVREMLPKISHAKYPQISKEEEEISIPLQVLSLGIFDAILVNMMNKLSPSWQRLRNDMCNKLNRHKLDRSIEILDHVYDEADVMFLQEVASSFLPKAKKSALGTLFDIHSPSAMDDDRDQNSLIMTKSGLFSDFLEITGDVIKEHEKVTGSKLPLEKGDLFVISCVRVSDHSKFLFASFHGDTNGLATKPVLGAVHYYAVNVLSDHKVLFGMDANTYAKPDKDQQGVTDFAEYFVRLKMNSCYGQKPNPLNFTTFHARTYLQTQLNKAVSAEEKTIKGDKNPKDFIVFFESDFDVELTLKDNTGSKLYVEGMVFPTLSFPSDHGISYTVLREKFK
jgi:hypothetical protein